MRAPVRPLTESTGAPSAGPVSHSLQVPATHSAPTAAALPAVSMLSRRSMVASMAAGLATAAPAVAAALDGEGTDARLLELGERYRHVCALEAAADEAYERACERVQEVHRPDVLRHRFEDHVDGLDLPFDQANAKGGFSADLGQNRFYTADEIRRLRRAPPLEEPEARAEQRTRIEEIEQAWQVHLHAFHAAEEDAGINAAQEAIDQVAVMKRILVKEIAAMPAKTMAGLRVRAQIVADLVEDTDEDDCNDDLMVTAIVRDILAMTT